MQKIRWFLVILSIVLALSMALQNNEPTPLKLLWLEASLPLSVLLLVASSIGFLFGALLTASMLRSRKAAKRAAIVAESKKEAAKATAKEAAETAPPVSHHPLR